MSAAPRERSRKEDGVSISRMGLPGVHCPAPTRMHSHRVRSTVHLPLCLHGELITHETGDGSGAQLAFRGGLALGGLGVEMVFRNTLGRTAEQPSNISTRAVLLPAGEWFEIPRKPFRARLEGDTIAWIQIRDRDGTPLTDHLYLGFPARVWCPVRRTFSTAITAETCVLPANGTVPSEFGLTLTGEMTFVRGFSARIVLGPRVPCDEHSRHEVLDLEIITPGQKIRFPEQPIRTGERGGALSSLTFLDGRGRVLSEHVL